MKTVSEAELLRAVGKESKRTAQVQAAIGLTSRGNVVNRLMQSRDRGFLEMLPRRGGWRLTPAGEQRAARG